MQWTPAHTELRNALAYLYDDQDSARRLAQDAGVKITRITWSTNAENNWQALLEESEKVDNTDAIILEALKEYGKNKDLLTAVAAYETLQHEAEENLPTGDGIAGRPQLQDGLPGKDTDAGNPQWNSDLSTEFHACLLDAYNHNSLKRLLYFEFDKKLENLVALGSFTDEAFELIGVARREGWIFELVARAHNKNPGNEALSDFAARVAALPSEQTVPPFSTQALKRLTVLYKQFRDDDLYPEQCEAAAIVIQDVKNSLANDEQLNNLVLDILLEQLPLLETQICDFKNQCRDHSSSSIENRQAIVKLLEQIMEDIDRL